MTILLSGNSLTPAQFTAGTKVAKATAGLPNSADVYAGQHSEPLEADEDAPFTLAPYLGQLVEDLESTSLPDTALLSAELPQHLSASDTHPMLQSEIVTAAGGNPRLTEIPTVSADSGFEFSSSAVLTAEIAVDLPLAQPGEAPLPEGTKPVEQLIASSSQELPTVTQNITTAGSSAVEIAPIKEAETAPDALLDTAITTVLPQQVADVLDDRLDDSLDNSFDNSLDNQLALAMPNLQGAAEQPRPLGETPAVKVQQIAPVVFTVNQLNSGPLAPAAPVLASLQTANNTKPEAVSERVSPTGASSSTVMPVFTAVTDELVKGNMVSPASMPPATLAMGLADNASLQQFLHQQSVAISPVSSNQFTLTPASPSLATTALPQWQSVTLAGAPTSWGPKLLAVLSDKVVLQMGQQVQRAQIRLDPPQLGNIELRIAVEGEKTTIQLFATNPQVREAMQQTLDLLRLNLGQQLGDSHMVDVQLGDQAQQQRAFFADELGVSQQTELVATEQQQDNTPRQQLGWLNRLA